MATFVTGGGSGIGASIVEGFVRQGAKVGFVDIGVLVNNAGRDDRHSIESVTVEFWDERLAVNLRHRFFASQAVVGQMKRLGGGSIINFGSISWMTATGGMPAYTTSKAAVQCLKGRLQPEDLANMVLFLASEDAKMITSQNFVVDAGWA